MKRLLIILSVVCFLSGCAATPEAPQKPADAGAALQEKLRQSMAELAARQKKNRRELQRKNAAPMLVEPIMPTTWWKYTGCPM